MKNKMKSGADEWLPDEETVEGISLPRKTLRESIIWRSAPILLKEDAENVAIFRRRLESEIHMLSLPDTRPTPERMENHIRHGASFMKTRLYAALYKLGMLDCVLMCEHPAFGFAWIKESLPVLSRHPMTKDMAPFYYREAACFAGKNGKWKLALEYARKGVGLLPKDASKVLWAAELHRVLAASLFKLKRFKEALKSMEVVVDLAKAHGVKYGPALWLRIHAQKEEIARATGDRAAEFIAKMCGIGYLEQCMPFFYEMQREAEVRLAWCLRERPQWLEDDDESRLPAQAGAEKST